VTTAGFVPRLHHSRAPLARPRDHALPGA
jgi:hypothetical protein